MCPRAIRVRVTSRCVAVSASESWLHESFGVSVRLFGLDWGGRRASGSFVGAEFCFGERWLFSSFAGG